MIKSYSSVGVVKFTTKAELHQSLCRTIITESFAFSLLTQFIRGVMLCHVTLRCGNGFGPAPYRWSLILCVSYRLGQIFRLRLRNSLEHPDFWKRSLIAASPVKREHRRGSTPLLIIFLSFFVIVRRDNDIP
jgi:hypothetical protein